MTALALALCIVAQEPVPATPPAKALPVPTQPAKTLPSAQGTPQDTVPMYAPVQYYRVQPVMLMAYQADECQMEAEPVEVKIKVKRRLFARRQARRAVGYGYAAPRGGLMFAGPLYGGGCD